MKIIGTRQVLWKKLLAGLVIIVILKECGVAFTKTGRFYGFAVIKCVAGTTVGFKAVVN
jgi:hypothetical protein